MESSFSSCFSLTCGVRQAGVLSPFLFDDMIVNLHNKILGCTVDGIYMYNMYIMRTMCMLMTWCSCQLHYLFYSIHVGLWLIYVQEMTYLDVKFNTNKLMVLGIGRARKRT